ncbi:MAG: hypothetical protein DI537_05265 [Stutzerimonas stutzeri]|nr:MAG: hypothetical protein DI537_05265 [Stutzerimonas stutzeri]
MLVSFDSPVSSGVNTRTVAGDFSENFSSTEYSVSDRLFAFKRSGLSMREATEKLGLSRNRTIFLCLKLGVDLAGSRESASAAVPTGRSFQAAEVSVLRDLIIRQGCSLETAARIMSIMVHDQVTADDVLDTCLHHKIEASSVRNAALRPKVIALAASAAPAINPIEALPFSQPAPTPEYRPLRLRLFEIADDQCHNPAGRDDEGVTVYCGLPRFSTREYCKACQDKLRVAAPSPKTAPKLKRKSTVAVSPKPATKPATPKPVNRYREYAMALESRARMG